MFLLGQPLDRKRSLGALQDSANLFSTLAVLIWLISLPKLLNFKLEATVNPGFLAGPSVKPLRKGRTEFFRSIRTLSVVGALGFNS